MQQPWFNFQYKMLGWNVFLDGIGIPSLLNSIMDGGPYPTAVGSSNSNNLQLWEITADILGGLPRNAWGDDHIRTLEAEIAGLRYLFMLLEISNLPRNSQNRTLNNLFHLVLTDQEEILRLANQFPLPGTGSINTASNNL